MSIWCISAPFFVDNMFIGVATRVFLVLPARSLPYTIPVGNADWSICRIGSRMRDMVGIPLIIKKSPFLLVKNLAVLEFLGVVVYFIAAVLGNYGEVYQELAFPKILSYEIAKFLFVTAAQFIILVFIFLRWFFDSYTVYPRMIVHEWGVFMKRRETVNLTPPLTTTAHFGSFSRFFNYGAVIVRDAAHHAPFVIHGIPNPKAYARLILGQDKPVEARFEEEKPLPDYLLDHEHEKLEFKSSLRSDMHTGKVNRALEHAVMKSVAAFLNSDGGRIVLGVMNGGEVCGIAADYRTLPRADSDGFENHFTNLFREMIGPEFRRFVKLSFHVVEGKEVCVISVAPSIAPVYMKFNNNEGFYIRTGNSSTALLPSAIPEYARSRWGKFA